MKRFELVEGSSSKFWEVERAGRELTTRWGRIGTAGQSKTKAFAGDEAAGKEHDALVREKLGKGYTEVGAPATAASSVAAVASAAPAPAGETAVEPAAAAPGPPTPAVVPASLPAETIAWTPALRRKVHARRGQGLEPLAVDAGHAFARVRENYAPQREVWTRVRAHDAALAPLLATVDAKLTATETPPLLSPEEEAAVLAVSAYRHHWKDPEVDGDVIDYWVAVGSVVFAVEAAILGQGLFARLERTRKPQLSTGYALHFVCGEQGSLARLRRHLASAPEADWAAARDLAAAARDGAALSVRASLAYLFPEMAAWGVVDAEEVLAQGIVERWAGALLLTVADPALLLRLVATIDNPYRGLAALSLASPDVGGTAATMVASVGFAAAPPLGKLLAVCGQNTGWRREVAEALAMLPSAEALGELLGRLELREMVPVASEACQRFPRLALPLLAAQAGQGRPQVEALLAGVVATHPRLVDEILPTLPESARRAVEAIRERTTPRVREATLDELPPALGRPPWTTGRKATVEHRALALTPLVVPEEMAWRPGERDEWLAQASYFDEWLKRMGPEAGERELLRRCRVADIPRRDGVLDDALVRAALAAGPAFRADAGLLALAPKGVALAIWETCAPDNLWIGAGSGRRLVATHELEALDGLHRLVKARPTKELLELCAPFRAPRLAPPIADAFFRLKAVRTAAQRWLLFHAEAAAIGLLPAAVGDAGTAREAAGAALRFLAANGHAATVAAVAARYGPEAAAAVEGVLAFDPLQLYPAKLPKLPAWCRPAAFARPLLRDRSAALPVPVVEGIATMLAFSRLEEGYAGLAIARETCDGPSLAAFAWDLFSAWLMAGPPAKEGWALEALGHLGDDVTARRLASLVREWPGEAAHARAVIGLDVLAAIGSDVALMHLNGIAQKVKFKGLQERAREKIAAIAERRGLTAEELADRLVPDLGLEEDGSLALDFGPRSFRVGFDEHLRPFVRDATGKRLPDLPKPTKSDDAAQAEAAIQRWRALKKDAKTLAGQQLLRLEQSMCNRRRFSRDVFQGFFVEHPLVQHLVRRVVWGVYDEAERLLATFRVAEDRTCADVADDPITLPEGARVGVVHAHELDAATEAAWGGVFGDYQILQPFPQLGREVYLPSEAERREGALGRFAGVKLPTGKVLGLDQRGWRRGEAQDGGVSGWYAKPLLGGRQAMLGLDPGIYAGAALEFAEQTLGTVTIEREGSWVREGTIAFGELDPVVFSELVRDLELLRA